MPIRRRLLRVLIAAQVLGGLGQAAGGAPAGPAVAVASYAAPAVVAAGLAALLAPVLLVSARRGFPAPAAPRTPPV